MVSSVKSSASILTIIGRRGSGKSTLTAKLAEQEKYNRKIVFDITNEWPTKNSYSVSTLDEFHEVWRKIFHLTKFTILVKFKYGTPTESVQLLASQISSLIYSVGEESGQYTTLIFEEAQFYFPNNAISPELFSLITIGRHGYVEMIANTQRPAQVHKSLISQSEEIYIGQTFEANDVKYLLATIGPIAEEARSLKPGEFIYYQQGNPETHIVDLGFHE